MKVFISWSGTRSKAMANALKDWIPQLYNTQNRLFRTRTFQLGIVGRKQSQASSKVQISESYASLQKTFRRNG